MDLFKTFVTAVPTSSIVVKVIFFVIGTTLLAWYTFGYVPTDYRRFVQSKEKIQAVSWYLGWNTITLVVPDWPRASQVLPSMDAYLETLDISLEKPAAFYFEAAAVDGGERVQKFREQVFAKISAKHGRDAANYYGVATNLLQSSPSYLRGPVPPDVQSDLQGLVSRLKLPEDLAQVPSQDLLPWLNSINAHFEKRL